MRHYLVFISFLILFSNKTAAEQILVAVSSNMSHAMQDISKAYSEHSKHTLKLSFGSSGNLAHQIINGAPHQIFLSANTDYIKKLQQANRTAKKEKVYALGQLSIYVPKESSFTEKMTLNSIYHGVTFNHYSKFAIANPKTAPYGQAAIETLRNLGLWSFDVKKIVVAENISKTTLFGLTSAVDFAFIPRSHCHLKRVINNGICISVPEQLHNPIIQTMVLTKSANEASEDFFNFMSSDSAINLLTKHGYSLPQI